MTNAFVRDDEDAAGTSILARVRNFFGFGPRAEEDEDDRDFDAPRVSPTPRQSSIHAQPTIRMTSTHDGAITVLPASSMADAQKAAERLKTGEPQIVNLEKALPADAQRLIDFLSGVVCALNGDVQKVSEGAYLFTPSSVMIHTEKAENSSSKARAIFASTSNSGQNSASLL
jgi:cell division inhibitor SepF